MAQLKVNEEMGHGTIKAPATIDPEADAGVLRKAMKGLGKCVCVCVCVFTLELYGGKLTVIVFECLTVEY